MRNYLGYRSLICILDSGQGTMDRDLACKGVEVELCHTTLHLRSRIPD